ncbi:hypothetical protein ACJIZ3_013032 [Penstemon smallii]|uniref:FRIGIDA-like protein n=1 Tax=Penstemon smallii TaxID=265156 RepID=A0ABD3UP32_9LAMI
MALTSVKSIERALELIDSKKENLKKAFEQLQSRSSTLSSFSITWPDLDSYFTSLQSELLHNFSTLQTHKPKPEKQKDSLFSESVPARPELKSLCEKMDGLGLRKYVIDRPRERTEIRVELADALKHAPDPGSIVLDALEGFWDDKLGSVSRLRTVCVVLLEELMRAGVEIGVEVRERARVVALEWKGKMAESNVVGDGDEEGKEEKRGLERLGYLQLLASYKLFSDGGGFDVNELIDHVVSSARYRQNVDLCRILGLESRIPDVIQRLIIKGRQLLALKFIFEFELTDEFPPVPLLKDYVMDTKKIAQKVRKGGKSSRQSLNDAAMKEISALKSVIKCIKDHGLESQYSKDELVKRIEKLEKEKADRKRPSSAAPLPKPQQQQQQMKQPKQNGIKRMKTGAAGPSAVRRRPPHPVPSSSVNNREGLLPNYAPPQYVGSPAGPYGMASAPSYGMQRAALVGFPGNLNPATSNPYPSETHAQPQPQPPAAYYDRPVPVGGYAGYEMPPQYHPVYYPH